MLWGFIGWLFTWRSLYLFCWGSSLIFCTISHRSDCVVGFYWVIHGGLYVCLVGALIVLGDIFMAPLKSFLAIFFMAPLGFFHCEACLPFLVMWVGFLFDWLNILTYLMWDWRKSQEMHYTCIYRMMFFFQTQFMNENTSVFLGKKGLVSMVKALC